MHRIVTRWLPSSPLAVVARPSLPPSVRLSSLYHLWVGRPSCICSFAPMGHQCVRRTMALSKVGLPTSTLLQCCCFFHSGDNFAMRHSDINFAPLCGSPSRLASGWLGVRLVSAVCVLMAAAAASSNVYHLVSNFPLHKISES